MSGAKEFWKYWTQRWPNASTDENKLKPSANYQETRAAFLAGFEAAQQGFAADETNRLRDLLWVGVLCGACGHSYKYNRADDEKGEKGHEEHLLAYPDCPSSRR